MLALKFVLVVVIEIITKNCNFDQKKCKTMILIHLVRKAKFSKNITFLMCVSEGTKC